MALFSGISVLLVRASWVAADSLVLLKIGLLPLYGTEPNTFSRDALFQER